MVNQNVTWEEFPLASCASVPGRIFTTSSVGTRTSSKEIFHTLQGNTLFKREHHFLLVSGEGVNYIPTLSHYCPYPIIDDTALLSAQSSSHRMMATMKITTRTTIVVWVVSCRVGHTTLRISVLASRQSSRNDLPRTVWMAIQPAIPAATINPITRTSSGLRCGNKKFAYIAATE
jgi:hypothetical protein